MITVNGRASLKIGGKYYAPGEEIELPEVLGLKLIAAGLATATHNPAEETAMKPSAEGGRASAKGNNRTNRGTGNSNRGKAAPKS